MNSVVVYCGSKPGNDSVFVDAANKLGRLLAERQITLIYGGGHCGMMGVLAKTVMRHGGKVIGVTPKVLSDETINPEEISELRLVDSMHERKLVMTGLAQGAIILPGGYGTLDEFFEFITWNQLGIHNKPCGIFNVAGYYDDLLAFTAKAVRCQFITPETRGLFVDDPQLETLMDKMACWTPLRPSAMVNPKFA